MEELLTLRCHLENQDYDAALAVVTELETMSKEDKLNKIYSFAVVLLIHLIKQAAENRNTRSWEFSIYNATKEIKRVNKRRKSGGYYATAEELREIIEDAFETALKKAALESFEGQYSEQELSEKINEAQIKLDAFKAIIDV
ncbi:MAG: DUF29 family protein [Cyanobacteria bacterium RI_101]|nr:DUF29 family protein [Cyanobacteria bacterium RI_101]